MRDVRLGSVFYGDLPCAYWPAHPPTSARPAPLEDTPYPVFVLASSTDPATPYAGALRIFDRLDDAYLIVQPGGPHIIFGRGNACPDDLVTAFLVDGHASRRAAHVLRLGGRGPVRADPGRDRRGPDADPLATLAAVDDEINNNGDYWNWDGTGTLRYGCLAGGRIAYVASDTGAGLTLRACAFSRGLPLTGRGVLDTEDGTFSLTVTAPHGTRLAYTRDADGVRSVSGTWFGTPVSLTLAAAPLTVPTRADRVRATD